MMNVRSGRPCLGGCAVHDRKHLGREELDESEKQHPWSGAVLHEGGASVLERQTQVEVRVLLWWMREVIYASKATELR
jgi:hypothetical protein